MIDGLDFTLNTETTTSAIVKVEQDRDAITSDIEAFVDAYNSFQSSLAQSMSYDETMGGGVFQGDSMARQLASSMRSSVTDAVNGLTEIYLSSRQWEFPLIDMVSSSLTRQS